MRRRLPSTPSHRLRRPLPGALSAALALSIGAGCKKVEPAPKDIDGLLHWFWTNYEDAQDERVHEAAGNLFSAVDKLDEDLPIDGTVSRLNNDEIAVVGVTDRTAHDAVGIFLLNRFSCSLADLEPILYHKQQDELYEGVYKEYERSYTSPLADYQSRDALFQTWDIRYVATLPVVGGTYTAEARGGLRRIPEIDGEVSPHGPALLARTWMPGPAEWEGDNDNKRFDQDYQVEAYIRDGGDILHLYGLWRSMEYGSGFSLEDEGMQRLILNNLADWDDNTAQLCADGRP